MVRIFLSALIAVIMAIAPPFTLEVLANSERIQACGNMVGAAASSTICQNGPDLKGGVALNVLNILLWVAAALSVVFVIWAGFQYTSSAGDSGKIGKAKNTLIFAVAGLAVSLVAGVIVRFIIDSVK